MIRHLRCAVLLVVLPLTGCKACRHALIDMFGPDESDNYSHIDGKVFERKGYDRDSREGRRLQLEQNNAATVEWDRQ